MMSTSPLAFWERPLFDGPNIFCLRIGSPQNETGHQSLYHGDQKASVQDVSVDLDTNYSLSPRALGCNILIVSPDFWQAFV